jgi:hypothetical protein
MAAPPENLITVLREEFVEHVPPLARRHWLDAVTRIATPSLKHGQIERAAAITG